MQSQKLNGYEYDVKVESKSWFSLRRLYAIMTGLNLIFLVLLLLVLFGVIYFTASPKNIFGQNYHENSNGIVSTQYIQQMVESLDKRNENLFHLLDTDKADTLSFDQFKIFVSLSYGIVDGPISPFLTVQEMTDLALCACGVGDLSLSPVGNPFCSLLEEVESKLCSSGTWSKSECYQLVSYYVLYEINGDDAIKNGYITKDEYIHKNALNIYNQFGKTENDVITLNEFVSLQNKYVNNNKPKLNFIQQMVNGKYIEALDQCINNNDKNDNLENKLSNNEIKAEIESYIAGKSRRRGLMQSCEDAGSGYLCLTWYGVCTAGCVAGVYQECIECFFDFVDNCFCVSKWDCIGEIDMCMDAAEWNVNGNCEPCVQQSPGPCKEACFCHAEKAHCATV